MLFVVAVLLFMAAVGTLDFSNSEFLGSHQCVAYKTLSALKEIWPLPGGRKSRMQREILSSAPADGVLASSVVLLAARFGLALAPKAFSREICDVEGAGSRQGGKAGP